MTTTELSGGAAAESSVPVLEAKSLTKHFPARRTRLGGHGPTVHAVDDVTLALPASGITAVVGESGSGKSTLSRMLAKLIEPTSGSVLLDGRLAGAGRRYARGRYARAVQLVLQDPFESLNPVHSVRYHLARPLQVHGLASGASLDSQVTELLERVSLTPADQFMEDIIFKLTTRGAPDGVRAADSRPGCR